jgi:hypothetical protein
MSFYVLGPLGLTIGLLFRLPTQSLHPASLGTAGMVLYCILASYSAIDVSAIRKNPLNIKKHPEVIMLDHMRDKHHLKSGIARWQSKMLSYACDGPYRLNNVQSGFHLEGWYLNMAWCLAENRPDLGVGVPEYNFAMVKMIPNDPEPTMFVARLHNVCGPPARIEKYGDYDFHIYDRPTDVAFRCCTYLPALELTSRPFPDSVVGPDTLRKYKGDASGWNGQYPDVVNLPPQGQSFLLAKPATVRNHVMELSLDNDDAYGIEFLANHKVVGSTELMPLGGVGGLRVRFVALDAHVKGADTIDSIRVIPRHGHNGYRLGHVFVYPDSRVLR